MPNSNDIDQDNYLRYWAQAHVDDASQLIKKPLVITEFGKSLNGSTVGQRDQFFWVVYETIYSSAKAGGPLCGGIFWQVMGQGMEKEGDGYQIIFPTDPSTANVILQQSQRISQLNH